MQRVVLCGCQDTEAVMAKCRCSHNIYNLLVSISFKQKSFDSSHSSNVSVSPWSF